MHAITRRRSLSRPFRRSRRSVALVAVALVALALLPGVARAANTGFVEVKDGQFVLDGHRFDFVGTVAFALLAGKIYGIESFTRDVVASARANNFRVVRIWGYFNGRPESIQPAPRQYNESALRALDWVIKQFDDAGVRLIVPFIGRYEDFGGMLTYAQWVGRGPNLTAFYTDPAAKALYKDYVRMLLNRTNTFTGRKYKDEPTILAWELADEPNLPDVDRSGNIFHAWASEMAAFVKSIDGNHLLGTGEEGYDTSPLGYSDVATVYNGNYWTLDGNKGVSYTRNTAIPHIDYGTFKFYPEYWRMPNKAASGAAWVRDHVRIARALGKPAVFSEFGDGASGQADDPAVFEAWLAALDQEGGGGAQFWQLVAPGWWCDQFCVIHPPASRIADALRAAAVRANSRSGGAAPGPPPWAGTSGSPPWARPSIEAIWRAGITSGCTPTDFCPNQPVTRAQLAIFLLRARHGGSHVPPAARGGVYRDVPAWHWAAPWIEQLAAQGLTVGCGGGKYCPDSFVSRAEMAVLLLRASRGPGYVPPAPAARFTDVPRAFWAAAWIEGLAASGIATGCAPSQYCPGRAVTRAEMALLIVGAFAIPM